MTDEEEIIVDDDDDDDDEIIEIEYDSGKQLSLDR
jgi:hypothetical protein